MHFLIILQVLSVLSTLSAAVAINRGRGLEPSQDIALEGPSANAFHSTSPTLYLTIPAKTEKAPALPRTIGKRGLPVKQSTSSSAQVAAKPPHSYAKAAAKPPPSYAKAAAKPPHSYAKAAAHQVEHSSAQAAAKPPLSYAKVAGHSFVEVAKQAGHDHAAKKPPQLQPGATTSKVTSKIPATKEDKAIARISTESPNCGGIPTCRECVENQKCRYVSNPQNRFCVDRTQSVAHGGVTAKTIQHCDFFILLDQLLDQDRQRITAAMREHVLRGTTGMYGRHLDQPFRQFLSSNPEYTSDPPDKKSLFDVAIIIYPHYRRVNSGSEFGVTHTTWDSSPGRYNWFSVLQMCQIAAHFSPGARGAVVVPNSFNGLRICIHLVAAAVGASAEEAQTAKKTCYPVAKRVRPDQPIGSSCLD